MKELSIEDKAKRYDEALEMARKCLDEKRDTCFVRPDVIFPELAESKDERIRKELLESFKYQQRESRTDKEWLNGIKLSEVVAWLEKQGEQKETLCDKCKKEQPSHSCQDITALGRCAIEKQDEKSSIRERYDRIKNSEWFKKTHEGMSVSEEEQKFHIIDEGKDEMDYCFTKMMNGEKVSSTWSEEDDAYKLFAISAVKDYYDGTNPLQKELVNWLKSLISEKQ